MGALLKSGVVSVVLHIRGFWVGDMRGSCLISALTTSPWLDLAVSLFKPPVASVLLIAYSFHVMVRVDRFQRGECLWSQPSCHFCDLEYYDSCCIRRDGLVFAGLSHRASLEYGWPLLWDYCWTGGRNSIVRIPETLVIRYCWHPIWRIL